jgi:hypothetical protein
VDEAGIGVGVGGGVGMGVDAMHAMPFLLDGLF